MTGDSEWSWRVDSLPEPKRRNCPVCGRTYVRAVECSDAETSIGTLGVCALATLDDEGEPALIRIDHKA